MDKYQSWILAQHLPPCPAGLCESVTARMAEAFPELTRLVMPGPGSQACPKPEPRKRTKADEMRLGGR